MIRIAITIEAFEAIAATLPLARLATRPRPTCPDLTSFGVALEEQMALWSCFAGSAQTLFRRADAE